MNKTLPKPPPMRRGDGGYEELGNPEMRTKVNHVKQALIETVKQIATSFIIVSAFVIIMEYFGVFR